MAIRWLLSAITVVLALVGLAPCGQGAIELAPGQIASEELILSSQSQEISVHVTGPSSNWVLDPTSSPSTASGSMVVEATIPWVISVSPDPTTNGCLAEYDPASSQFVSDGHRLKSSLSIRAESGNEVDLSKGGILAEGTDSKTLQLTFRQDVAFDDPVLSDGHEYRMILEFTSLPSDVV
jgi:hypothetical protein